VRRLAKRYWLILVLALIDVYLIVKGLWWAALIASAGVLIRVAATAIVTRRTRVR
jgi:hypothetical protein